jgi:hypothetical protein
MSGSVEPGGLPLNVRFSVTHCVTLTSSCDEEPSSSSSSRWRIAYGILLVAHHLQHIAYGYSPFAISHLPFAIRYWLAHALSSHCSFFIVHCSLFIVHYLLHHLLYHFNRPIHLRG